MNTRINVTIVCIFSRLHQYLFLVAVVRPAQILQCKRSNGVATVTTGTTCACRYCRWKWWEWPNCTYEKQLMDTAFMLALLLSGRLSMSGRWRCDVGTAMARCLEKAWSRAHRYEVPNHWLHKPTAIMSGPLGAGRLPGDAGWVQKDRSHGVLCRVDRKPF